MNEGRTLTIPMVWFKEKGVAETGRQKTRNEKPELGSGFCWVECLGVSVNCHHKTNEPERVMRSPQRSGL